MSSSSTAIEWTDRVWNPTRGCSRVSPGCERCYAERVAARFSGPGGAYEGLVQISTKERSIGRRADGAPIRKPVRSARWNGEMRLNLRVLAEPLSWRQPAFVFVNSMSDLFHENLSNEQIAAVFGVMAACPMHTFQILTKREDRLLAFFRWVASHKTVETTPLGGGLVRALLSGLPGLVCAEAARSRGVNAAVPYGGGEWPLPNVWLGVSVENQEYASRRVPVLLATPAAVRFVSYEPALGPVSFDKLRVTGQKAYATSGGWTLDALRPNSYRADPWPGVEGYGSPVLETPPLDWIIVGGESGPNARPFDVQWARDVVLACERAGVACFVKQLGANVRWDGFQPAGGWWPEGTEKNKTDKTGLPPGEGWRVRLDDKKGGAMEEWPMDIRVRNFPRGAAA